MKVFQLEFLTRLISANSVRAHTPDKKSTESAPTATLVAHTPPKISNFQPAAMTPLPTPASQDAAVTLFFREKAFWTFGRGQRLNDDRRQMRQYKRTEDQVFPTGSYFKGGQYGHTIQFPVSSSERSNPLFNGCVDRNP